MKRDFLFRIGGSCLVWCSVTCATAFGEEAKIWSDEPIVCHWIGANYKETSTYGKNAGWTDPGNWAEGIVPGRFLYNGETNGCAGCTAVFDRACDYSVIDLDGLVSISNVTVRGSEVPQIEFGKWEWNNPYFILERGGGITVEDDVVRAPVFHGAIRFFKGGEETVTSVTYRNDSADVLTVSGFDGPDPAFVGYKGICTIRCRGTGDLRQVKRDGRNGFSTCLDLGLEGGGYVYGVSDNYLAQIITVPSDVPQHLTVEEGMQLNMASDLFIKASSDLLVDGDGVINIPASYAETVVSVLKGKNLIIDCDITGAENSALKLGWWDFYGTVKLTGSNTFGGGLNLFGVTLSVDNFGVPGEPGPLGKGNSIKVTSSACISYTGSGGDLPHGISLENTNLRIVNAGAGELRLTGGVGGSVTTKKLALDGKIAISSDISVVTEISEGADVAFRKVGTEDCTISLATVRLTADCTVDVDDGVTVVFGAMENNGFKLDVRTSGSGKLVFSGAEADVGNKWLTINGKKSVIGGGGVLYPRDSVPGTEFIDARGGVIDNDPYGTVVISTASGEPGLCVTPSDENTSIMMLRQRQGVEDVLVSLPVGGRLSAGVIAVEAGAKPLTLGVEDGTGVLAPSGDSLELEVGSPTGLVTVNADIDVPSKGKLVKSGEGTVVLTGNVKSLVEMEDGKIVFEDEIAGISVSAANSSFYAGRMPSDDHFLLALTNGTVSVTGTVFSSHIVLATNGTACLEITDGCITGRLYSTRGVNDEGALRLKGGECVHVSNEKISGPGYSYFKIEDGAFKTYGSVNVNIASDNNSVLEMAGGTFIHENGNLYFGNSSNARGVFYMSGGRAVLGGDMRMPTYNATGCGVVTIAGEDASIEFINGKGIFLALLATDRTGYGRSSMVNLNAGKLTANYIARHGWYSNVTEKAYVNFNGGTYRYTAWGDMFGSLTSPYQYRVDRVTSFEKGAVLELPNNCSSSVPICAPEGKGIKSISWSPLSGLSGSPVVVISDEDGVGDGASAFAFVDESGTVTNIQVTSPGWNYTSAKARLYCNRTKLLAEFDCVLEEQVSGGLTKTGGGTFTMNATNTYTGATVLKNGKILLEHPDVIDARSELVLDGGTLDLNGMAQTFSSVRGAAGSVVNGTLGLSGLRVDLSDAVAGRYPEIGVPVVFAEGAEVSVLNVEAGAGRRVFPVADFAGGVNVVPMLSDEALDALPVGDGVWKLAMSGTVLKLYRARGSVLTFR